MPKLGELLIEARVITEEQLDMALRAQAQRGGRLGWNLVELGFVAEGALAKVLSKQLRIPAATAAALDRAPKEVIRLLPADAAASFRAVPVRLEGTHLWVAMSDPSDRRAIAALDAVTAKTVRPMVASDLLIAYALEKHYGISARNRPSEVARPHADLSFETAAYLPDPFVAARAPAEAAASLQIVELDEVDAAERVGLSALATRIVAASSQEDVLEGLIDFLVQDFSRLAVLVLRGGRLCGYRGRGAGLNLRWLLDFTADPKAIPVISKVLTSGKPRLGLASEQTLGSLSPLLGSPGERAVLVMPLRCAGEAIGCIVGVGGREGVEGHLEEYVGAEAKADLALQMAVLRKRVLEGP